MCGIGGVTQVKKVQKIQNRQARTVTGGPWSKPSEDILEELGWCNLEAARHFQKVITMLKIVNCLAVPHCGKIKCSLLIKISIRTPVKTDLTIIILFFTGVKIWNTYATSIAL